MRTDKSTDFDWSRSFRSLLVAAGLAWTGAASADIAVYHSPDDSGTDLGPVTLPATGTSTLHLYIDPGSQSSGPGNDPCCAGQGDEILGWDLRFYGAEGLTVGSVDPVEPDATLNRTPTSLLINGGDFRSGDLGPTKVADVEVITSGGGFLALLFGQVVGPSLALETLEPKPIVSVPEPGLGTLLLFGSIGLTRLRTRRPWRRR